LEERGAKYMVGKKHVIFIIVGVDDQVNFIFLIL